MCGVVGLVSQSEVSPIIYDALTILQHRGQDAAGIATSLNGQFRLRKSNGLVSDIFYTRHMQRLEGHLGIGHVRYPTAGSSSKAEAQPFYVNSPYGIALAHNGNLDNSELLRDELLVNDRRHIHTQSDTEVLLNIFAHELLNEESSSFKVPDLFNAINGQKCLKELLCQIEYEYVFYHLPITHPLITLNYLNYRYGLMLYHMVN
jgi:amidophosphoribosyltransferase